MSMKSEHFLQSLLARGYEYRMSPETDWAPTIEELMKLTLLANRGRYATCLLFIVLLVPFA